MSENMTVSVIIPCYNAEKTIQKTIESIYNQTFKPKEIILVNDGSTDKTLQIVKNLLCLNSAIDLVIIEQENKGVAQARNNGVNRATGEWIAFCDSDDIWYDNKLEILSKYIKNNVDANFFFHEYKINGKQKMIDISKIDKMIFLQLFQRCFIQTSTVLLKKNLFNKTGGFNTELQVAEDYDLWLRCVHFGNCKKVPYILSDYNIYGSEHLSREEKRMFINTVEVIISNARYIKEYRNILFSIIIAEKRFLRYCLAYAFYFFTNKKVKDIFFCLGVLVKRQKDIMDSIIER